MKRRSSNYFIGADTSDKSILDCAEAAQSHEGHLNCILLASLPNLPYFKYGTSKFFDAGLPANWLDQLEEKRAELESRATEVEALLASKAVSANVKVSIGSGADLKHLAARQSYTCDVAFLDAGLRNDPEIFREVGHGVLFHSPAALMINGNPFAHRDCVVFAWDGSFAASRAAHLGLHYFLEAKEVVIACIDPPSAHDPEGHDTGADIATWLSHHGCRVTVSQFPRGGLTIQQCIQERAKEVGADLIVMGAYGHSYLRESVFGGTTQAMLEQASFPVLFGH
ncbi:universal stress protein [Ruegeria atlantica]|uniref:universal stress protein n=1 Tax=Ruegeria atlantica TaxID=81569 RepID=UPI00147AFBE2|nr:universal stress protein [Ruegeria atlantica]